MFPRIIILWHHNIVSNETSMGFHCINRSHVRRVYFSFKYYYDWPENVKWQWRMMWCRTLSARHNHMIIFIFIIIIITMHCCMSIRAEGFDNDDASAAQKTNLDVSVGGSKSFSTLTAAILSKFAPWVYAFAGSEWSISDRFKTQSAYA